MKTDYISAVMEFIGHILNHQFFLYGVGAAVLLLFLFALLIKVARGRNVVVDAPQEAPALEVAAEPTDPAVQDNEVEAETQAPQDEPVEERPGNGPEYDALEKKIRLVYELFPFLEGIERLHNHAELDLTEEDTRALISQTLSSIGLSPDIMDPRSDERPKIRLKDYEKRALDIARRVLSEIDAASGRAMGSADGYLILGNAEFMEGRYERAVEYYDLAIVVDFGASKAWNNKGVALVDLGRHDEALECFERAVSQNDCFSEAWYGKGVAFEEKGDYQGSLECFEKSIALNPKYHEVWYDKGLSLSKLARYEDAVTVFERALALHREDAKAWHGLGIALSCLGRHEEAFKAYDYAVSLKYDDVEAWYGRGIALSSIGDHESALRSFDEALALRSDDAKSWYGRGMALRRMGRPEEALGSFNRCVGISPDYPKAWYSRACLYAAAGDPESAVKDLARAILLDGRLKERALREADFSGLVQHEEFIRIMEDK